MKAPVPESQPEATAEQRFAGVRGLFGQWANFGIIGVVAGLLTWFVVWGMPGMQSEFHTLIDREREHSRREIAAERQTSREESAKSREHGDRSAKIIADSIDRHKTSNDESQRQIIQLLQKIESKSDRIIPDNQPR